jgi:hypothetical protein
MTVASGDRAFLSRDLVVAIMRRYGSLRRFHCKCLQDRMTYYLLLKAVNQVERPIEQIRIIEEAAAGLTLEEEVRGRVPVPDEALRLAARRVVAAVEVLLGSELTFNTMRILKERTEELKVLCSS